jgi:hypothetical protein
MTRHAATALFSFCLAASAFCQDVVLYPIVRNGKTGFIDLQGNMVIDPQFAPRQKSSAKFSEGLEPIANGSSDTLNSSARGAWGYIDSHGIVRIPFQFSQAEPFSEGLAAVEVTS